MRESVKAALGYIKSNWRLLEKFIIEPIDDLFEKIDIHIHFPAGAI
jgi:ATP-dependent Lon protease